MAKPTQRQERVYSSTESVDHDLFRLNLATCKKNMSYNSKPTPSDFVDFDHVHYYHTVDSNGQPQKFSSRSAGHFHIIEITKDKDGGVPQVKCVSGPMIWGVKQNEYGQTVQTPVPAINKMIDSHTHEIDYIKSDKVQLRRRDMRAAQAEAEILSKRVEYVAGVEVK